ncbi:PilW family protein [Desulfobotulus mexicanus]|uniref:Prepilin-type N-terminal cleavage/methylation domain-containing protein n=1 Tax=Desulfobotulus mexicanus TaxID=2586642 RepID=A0A5Q4VFN3_9BACT|nr:PilW family protein [Desulfobotulus mexicanus]TYT75082.1 hypothetical protein FIM25_06720 [Desulfobotulus mexicanus]
MKYLRRVERMYGSNEGITLVELLIVLALSLVLGTGIYQVFVGTTRSYSLNEELARLQEDGRMAMNFLRTEIRGAGYLGCLQDVNSVVNVLQNPDNFTVNFTGSAIYGLEADNNKWKDNANSDIDPTTSGLNGMGLNPEPLHGSDILVIRGVRSDLPSMEIKPHSSGNSASDPDPDDSSKGSPTFHLTSDNLGFQLENDSIIFISDCSAAAVLKIHRHNDNAGTIVYNSGGNQPRNDKDKFSALRNIVDNGLPAEVFLYHTAIYYVGEDPVTSEPTLFTQSRPGSTQAQAIISGVENFQVRYGEDTTGDGMVNRYADADEIEISSTVNNWENVLSVRIGLLLRTPESRDPTAPVDTAEYDVSGDGTTDFTAPGDRRMRMVFSGTVGLRNRIR